MPMHEIQRKLYNMYHGNDDLNMVSQIKMLCEGKSNYKNLYSSVQTVLTNNDEDINSTTASSSSKLLVLHQALSGYDAHMQYTTMLHYTPTMLKCPIKNLNKEKCSGQFLLDLCKQTIANIKKACVIADKWLVHNEKPSGTNWDDLYAHLIESYESINPREKVFTGIGNFICHTKYNKHGKIQNRISK